MGFDYDRIHKKEEHANYWTSYSDLFLMLTTVFLLLFVVASLRSGAYGVNKNAEYQKLAKEAEDLREQIRVYNTLKDEQLKHENEDEQQTYSNLMDKLALLKEEAKQEKENLRKQARENEKKETALNQYQQLIRNIINANILAKTQIKRRDEMIQTKDSTITVQTGAISQLNSEVQKKERLIAQNKAKIEEINGELADKIERIKAEQKRAHSSKQAMLKKIAQLKQESQSQITELETRTKQASQELAQVRSNLQDTESKLTETSATLEKTSATLENVKTQSAQERAALVAQLEKTKAGYQGQIAALQADGERKLAAERAAFEKGLAAARLSAAEKGRREAEFRKRAEGHAAELAGRLADLQGRARANEAKLAEAMQGQSRAIAAAEGLKRENASLSKDLQRAKELAEARKNLANAIKGNFAKAGIKAEVDDKTGEVTLAFPDDYFETGQAFLKPGMENRLKTFIPAYTKSLFNDPKTAEKIQNVEIIGFASSTYKGKYVNPQSLKPKDREAIDYNLRLSFDRANAIFKYIFDTKNLTYKHQTELLPMVKVVGRGYLPEGKQGGDIPEGLSEKTFCEKYNCRKAQKVVIKFNLKD